ncbi:MAG: sigma 54-interacting transcriptional regulator [Clostridium sp.]|nr:sigma 54-interacting transcriptional regulator [Clostridium sp.]
MKKQISVITLIPRSSRFYADQVQALFGDHAEVRSYSTGDRSVESLQPSDLYLVSTDAFEEAEAAKQYVPSDGQVVEIQLTYPKEVIRRLKKIPRGTRALFVNATRQMAREAITQLEQLGVNQLGFEPYGPDSQVPEGISLAVTPDEMDFVPEGMEEVINIGHRPCTPGTMIEMAIRLELEGLLEEKGFRNYMKSMAAGNYSFDQMFVRSRKMESRFDILMDILDEGMIGVNEKGEVYACNQKAAEITGVNRTRVSGKIWREVFPYIPFDACMEGKSALPPKLIRIGTANINLGLVPVLRNGECIGAFAALQRFNDLEKRQNELRSQLLHKGYRAKYRFEDVIGHSQAVEKTKAILRKMAVTESPVLLIGETGTGKELLAHAVHLASGRSQGPFVAINVAAMPENLLESELFGYEEGAFTGAKKGGRPGLFEFAHKGTLFLDEVEGMSQAMQVKLLRVLQEQEIMRVGGNQIIYVDVRIVAATNESLEEKVEDGSFRRDLYYRLNALPVLIPPLRERGDDILLLLETFRIKSGGRFRLSEEVRRLIMEYPWPGNIRELQNVVEYLSFTGQDEIKVVDLPPTFVRSKQKGCPPLKAPAPAPEPLLLNLPGRSAMSVPGNPSENVPGQICPEGFWFVLEQLYRASRENRMIGREGILKAARDICLPLSQKEVRTVLSFMAERGIAKVSKGRGGSRITPIGQNMWEQYERLTR